MPNPKPFQIAAIDAACDSFTKSSGSKRFLVADEVGLGKTVVAQQVIERLAGTDRRSPFVVYYITNGQRVAHQNRDRLVDHLDEADQEEALSKADRLNLIPFYERPKAPVALYALTPGTSFPGKPKDGAARTGGGGKGRQKAVRLHAGRKEERAFLTALLDRAYPGLVRRFPIDTMKRQVKSNWEGLVRAHRAPVRRLSYRFIGVFKSAVRTEFGGKFEPLIPGLFKTEKAGRFVGRLRRALGHAVLLDRPPDLVILDEFQRYRDMLSAESRRDPLIKALFEPEGERRPALLLLSATPYKLFATRLEENRGAEASREFFDLLAFLGGKRGAALKLEAEQAFAKFGSAVLSIARQQDDLSERPHLVAEAESLRDGLQAMLAPYVSRMEREPTPDDSAKTIPLNASLDSSDIRVFRHLVASFKPEQNWFALPYWLSVPLPAQTLGNRYKAWKEGKFKPDRALVTFTSNNCKSFSMPREWPNPKLRALAKITPAEALALPWVAPSISWWPLRGGWENLDQEQKLLLFSRFKATPQSVAALTSFGVESRYLARERARDKTLSYKKIWKRRRLQAGPKRLPIVALFHPSLFLIENTDPLLAPAGSSTPPRDVIRKQLLGALTTLDIKVIRKGKKGLRHKPLWTLLSALEFRSGHSKLTKAAWTSVASTDQRLRSLVDQWHVKRELDWISGRELDDLVMAALGAPGVIVGRALLRHFKEALTAPYFEDAVRLAWQGLRSYVDNPVFWARLPGGTAANALQRACIDGNLEAVLDEHFWMRRQSLPTRELGLAEDLLEALGISTGGFSLHSVNENKSPRIHVRCHVAVPFGSTEDKERSESITSEDPPPRSDELRKAFNSPFWPHVLATTSVGQEGLDFHTWCSRILHWDLCSSPIELEQREGRIQRFGGLAVRRELKNLPPTEIRPPGAITTHSSLWDRVRTIADAKYLDASGLSPWWVLEHAKVSRYVFDLPQSRDAEKFELLKEQRLIYRLALGQPNQEDLVDFLAKGGKDLTSVLQPLTLNLSAFARAQKL